MEDLEKIIKNEPKFANFFELLIETNEKMNLTAITDKEEVYEKHFLDSLQAISLINSGAKVLDVGAGAGFPSIPLAICKKDANFVLIDSLNKRINFLNSVKNQLKLQNIECFHDRIEDFAQKNTENFDFVVARGVASLPTLLEYCAKPLKIGGKIIAYKGSNFSEELENAQNAISKLGLKFEKSVKYILKNCNQNRFLLIFSKISHTPSQFPRKNNKPRTMPL